MKLNYLTNCWLAEAGDNGEGMITYKYTFQSLSRGVPSSHLEKDERLIRTHMYLFMKASRVVLRVFGFARNRWLNTLYGIVWKTKYGRFTTLNIPKCEHFTLLVCPLRFLVISAMRRLGNVQSFKTYMFRFWTFCHERDPTLTRLHGKLSPQLTGLPYLNVSVTSPTWGLPTPCKQALTVVLRRWKV